MSGALAIPSERPAKRVRQACEPCRRKKARCPGEQPVCSLCARLHQECVYTGERRRSPCPGSALDRSRAPATTIVSSPSIEDRLSGLADKVEQILAAIDNHGVRPVRDVASSNPSVPLPGWNQVLAIAKLYLLYCDCQPLPLFHRDSFLSTLEDRDPEIIHAMLALSARFLEPTDRESYRLASQVNSFAETARNLAMRRVSEGPVELSTLQTLCLLSFVDFTNGNTHRSAIHSSLAMNLVQCANLGAEAPSHLSAIAREERSRCFWSICLLKRLHGGTFDILDLPEGGGPPFPESVPKPPLSHSSVSETSEMRSTDMPDQGIMAYVIMLSEVFSRASRYVRLHGKPSNIPPWSSQSEYSKIITLQMHLETRMPYIHRFKPSNLNERTPAELQAHRQYWGPWLLNQFLYHTSLCLLNHPLLLSLCLRNFHSTIPEIFLQHTSDLISSHTTWIIHFIKVLEEKSFEVSDPFLGYSAAVIATIELQLSFNENPSIRQEKRERFSRCLDFVRKLGERWPHMARTADRLQKLEGAVTASYRQGSDGQNKSLLIDLSRFWEILEYSPNSDTDSARRLFGNSLYSGPAVPATEVSRTAPLPEPYRLNEQDTKMLARALPPDGDPAFTTAACDYGIYSDASSRALDIANDEFSILAANFFSQGQEFLRSWDNREGIGNF